MRALLVAALLTACSDGTELLDPGQLDGGNPSPGDAGLAGPWISSVSARNEVCISRRDGTIACSASGEIGGLTDALSVSVGASHACALRSGGQVACWGNNEQGQLGVGSTEPRAGAQQVVGLPEITALSAGTFSTCALDTAGWVWCWGRPLGEADTPPVVKPARLPRQEPVRALSVGWDFACAVLESGARTCWGVQPAGSDPGSPLLELVEVAAGAQHACARARDGTVECWGAPNSLGVAADRSTRVRLGPVPGLRGLSAGYFGTCLLGAQPSCFGNNIYNALGPGQGVVPAEPPRVPPALTEASPIVVGHVMTCGVVQDRVRCVGFTAELANGPGFAELDLP